MSKKKTTSMDGKSALRVALPVIIGLIVVAISTVIIAIASKPKANPQIDNPKDVYANFGSYQLSNDKLYTNMKYSYGVSEMTTLIDTDLLKDISVDRTSAEYKAFVEKLIYGEDAEELTKEEKDEKAAEYKDKLLVAGYDEDDTDAYFDLEYRRNVYAKKAYAEYIAEKGYTAEELAAGYAEMEKELYTSTAKALTISFNTSDLAKKVMAKFGIDTAKLTSDGWVNAEKEAKRLSLLADITALEDMAEGYEEQIAGGTLSDAEKTEKEAAIADAKAQITEITNQILAFGIEKTTDTIFMTIVEVQQAFINMYNYMNAYYLGGDATKYFDADNNLLPEYQVLKEGVNYEFVDKTFEYVNSSGDQIQEVRKVIKFIDLPEDDQNPYVKYNFTKDEATEINSNVSSQLFTTLSNKAEDGFFKTYTLAPKEYSSGNQTFLALLVERNDAPENNYDFDEEVDDDKVAPTDEMIAEIEEYLIEEKFNDDITTQMLLILRADHGLKIYDTYLEAVYKAAYDYLYGTTLKITDYPEYEATNKVHKTKVYEYTNSNGATVELSAQQLFTNLEEKHGVTTTLSLMANHIILSNKDYNTLYNPYTGETYDLEALKKGTENELINIKYYFDNDYYKSAGFPATYGWEKFLHDYLRMEDERELVLNMVGIEDAYNAFYKTTYDDAKLKEQMNKIWDEYFSMSVINLLVYTDYNNDGNPDEFVLEEGKSQEYWSDQQMAAVNELTALAYKLAKDVDATSLAAQLAEIANEYEAADYDDAVWGKYKKLGLHVKAEAAADYTSTSNLVEEFITECLEVYKNIEKDGKLGVTFDAPHEVAKVFPTVFGYHKIAIVKSTARPHVSDEVDETLDSATKRDAELAKLTKDLYELYVEMQAEDYETNKADILSELGFVKDYVMPTNTKNALATYYDAAVKVLEGDTYTDLAINNLRKQLVENDTYTFADSSKKALYDKIEAILIADLEETLAESNK